MNYSEIRDTFVLLDSYSAVVEGKYSGGAVEVFFMGRLIGPREYATLCKDTTVYRTEIIPIGGWKLYGAAEKVLYRGDSYTDAYAAFKKQKSEGVGMKNVKLAEEFVEMHKE